MDLVLRAAVVYVFLFLVTRLVGRRELSGLEPFDLILIVVIGDLVQQAITQTDASVTGAFLVVATLALLTVVSSFLSYRFRRMRPLLEGRPLLLVENGVPIEENMKRERITIEEIEAAARLQNIASLSEVRWAILETGGQISFIKREGSS